tara:strand:+ start:368 stop:622 length:255 start_codon:yes stop_codon:yes gene_type:complete
MKKRCATGVRTQDTAKGKKGTTYQGCWVEPSKPRARMKIPKITITEEKKKADTRVSKVRKYMDTLLKKKNRPVGYLPKVRKIRL